MPFTGSGRRAFRQGPPRSPRAGRRAGDQARGSAYRESARPGPPCPIQSLCRACRYVNLDYAWGLGQKFEAGAALLAESGAVDPARILPPVAAPRPLAYRSLFKLAVRPAFRGPLAHAKGARPGPRGPDSRGSRRPGDRFAIGLFEPGTHDVVDLDDCPLHTPPLEHLLRGLRIGLNRSPIAPFDERTRAGNLRYVAARSSRATGEVMVTFVVVEPGQGEIRRLLANLKRSGQKFASAHMNVNAGAGNAVFGPRTERLTGSPRLRERSGGLDLEMGPTSFFQVNPWQADNLYGRIEEIAGPAGGSAAAWDLYCGIGPISLLLARLGYKVAGIEENPFAVADAGLNARKNGLENRASFIAARVEDAGAAIPAWAQRPDLIVVNPSRGGLAEPVRAHLIRALRANPRTRLIYVSCEALTLARDLKDLAGAGLRARRVEPFDMFPQTDKLEWLVLA